MYVIYREYFEFIKYFKKLNIDIIEIKRMLATFIKKLNADS